MCFSKILVIEETYLDISKFANLHFCPCYTIVYPLIRDPVNYKTFLKCEKIDLTPVLKLRYKQNNTMTLQVP